MNNGKKTINHEIGSQHKSIMISEQAALLLITGVLVVLLVAAAFDSLANQATTGLERTKPEVNWTKQDDKAMIDLNAARGCIITEDVGRTILWKCPAGLLS